MQYLLKILLTIFIILKKLYCMKNIIKKINYKVYIKIEKKYIIFNLIYKNLYILYFIKITIYI